LFFLGRIDLLDAHLADLLSADRRWRDSFAAGIAANGRRYESHARRRPPFCPEKNLLKPIFRR
jgi:hypothetical protein